MLRAGNPEDAGFHPGQIERIRERAVEWLERGPAKSMVLLAARNGVIALHEAHGVARYDSTAPLSKDAVFWSSSMTKPVTATAVMMLVEDGAFSLNRPLQDFFPELTAEYSERILVHQLLTHTSGISQDVSPAEPTSVALPEGQHPYIHRALQPLFGMELYEKPGKQNVYTNANFTLLGELVRRVSGQRLDAFAREHIFDPLGMQATSIGREAQDDPLSVSFDPAFAPEEFRSTDDVREFIEVPDGGSGLHTTAGEIAIFAELFRNGGEYDGVRLLNDWTVAEMTRNQIPGIGTVSLSGGWIPEASWGLGWMVQGDARWRSSHGMLQPRGTFYHQGASGCAFWVDPVHDVVGAYMSSVPILDFETGDAHWEFDTFQNMVTAAVDHR